MENSYLRSEITRIGGPPSMTSISASKPSEKLLEPPLNADGERVELQGHQRNTFAAELKVKILANRTIAMLKEFPGFCDWWFEELHQERRDYIHEELQIKMLNEFGRLRGLTEQKAEQMSDCVVRYFDNLPGFTQWTRVVAGADLRGRVNYQLKDHLWEEMRGAYR